MAMPEIAKQVGDRITYKPVVAEVSVHSSYNKQGSKQRFALKGVGDKDDFWALDKGVLDLHPELGELPAVGTLGVWTLQKALVTGQYAGTPDRPKYYRDVIKFERVPDGYVAPAVKPVTDVDDLPWGGEKDEPVAQAAIAQDAKAQAVSAYDDREARTRISIEQQVAFKGYAEVLAAVATVKAFPVWLMPDKTNAIDTIVDDFMRLGAILSHLPPMPAKPEEPDGTPSNQ